MLQAGGVSDEGGQWRGRHLGAVQIHPAQVTEVLQAPEGVISHRATAAQTELWRTDGQRLEVLQTTEGVISHRTAAAQTQLWWTDGQRLQRYCRLKKASSATARQLRRLSSGGQTDRGYRGTADSRRRHQPQPGSCADSALADRRADVTEVLQTPEGVISHRPAAAQTQL